MTQREEFEKYALTRVVDKRSLNYNHADGHYVEWLVEEMYRAWQAAKTQAVPETNKAILQSLRDMVEIVGANFCSNQDVKRKYKIARELLEQTNERN